MGNKTGIIANVIKKTTSWAIRSDIGVFTTLDEACLSAMVLDPTIQTEILR